MEFHFDLKKTLNPDPEGFSVLHPVPNLKTKQISEIIDTMGRESARAQNLHSTITTSQKFYSSSDNKIYLKIQDNKVVGMLKTGFRNLFYTNEIGKILEIKPLCLLDFYVNESFQRTGYGKALYEFMLRYENATPNKIAIDRPSNKLIGFMRKHYSLSDYVPQSNHYVVYRLFFNPGPHNRRSGEEAKNNNPVKNHQPKKENSNSVLNGQKMYFNPPPWAVSNFGIPKTTSSQYGSYNHRK
jgi:alpha-tubulin N-acetyltransferase 1